MVSYFRADAIKRFPKARARVSCSPMAKKKLDNLTKTKIMFAVEYAIFVVVFAVLGTLFLTDVIKVAEWKRYLFTYVTLAGGAWIIVDFFWTLLSPKRRAKNCLLDKALLLPVGPVLLTFDIYAITQGCAETLPYRWVIGADLCYIAVVFAFETIYHWYKPLPQLFEAVAEMDAADAEEAAKVTRIEMPKEETKENAPDGDEEKKG